MKRLLLKLLGNSIYTPEPVDAQKLQVWLFKSYKDDGFKNYYTMRKKYLVNLLLQDLSEKERNTIQGRLLELKQLSTNINSEFKKRTKIIKLASSGELK